MKLQAGEVKSGETIASDFFKGLDYWRENLPGRDLDLGWCTGALPGRTAGRPRSCRGMTWRH